MSENNERISWEAFKALRESTGLNINEAADVLTVSRDTIRIWEGQKKRRHDRRAHPSAVAYLRCIDQNPELVPPHWPDRLLKD